jgi:hypothetical protein
MDDSTQDSSGTQKHFRYLSRLLGAILLGGVGGLCVFGLGMTVVAMATDGSKVEMAKMLRLTESQLDAVIPIGAVGSIAVGAISCGIATARLGRIIFGPRTQWTIRGTLIVASGIAAGCFIAAFLRGDSEHFRWWVSGAEWALRITPVAVLVGALFGNFAYQIFRRRSR